MRWIILAPGALPVPLEFRVSTLVRLHSALSVVVVDGALHQLSDALRQELSDALPQDLSVILLTSPLVMIVVLVLANLVVRVLPTMDGLKSKACWTEQRSWTLGWDGVCSRIYRFI